MVRPVTLFTGQWADLPFAEVCRLADADKTAGTAAGNTNSHSLSR